MQNDCRSCGRCPCRQSVPDVRPELAGGSGVLVKLLLQQGSIVGEALLPSKGIPCQLLLALVQGELGSAVPLVLHTHTKAI